MDTRRLGEGGGWGGRLGPQAHRPGAPTLPPPLSPSQDLGLDQHAPSAIAGVSKVVRAYGKSVRKACAWGSGVLAVPKGRRARGVGRRRGHVRSPIPPLGQPNPRSHVSPDLSSLTVTDPEGAGSAMTRCGRRGRGVVGRRAEGGAANAGRAAALPLAINPAGHPILSSTQPTTPSRLALFAPSKLGRARPRRQLGDAQPRPARARPFKRQG